VTLQPTFELPRPAPAPDEGALDHVLYDLVERRFRRLVADRPTLATFVGIHDFDHELGDGTCDAIEQGLADDRAHLTAVEALDPAHLSAQARFERDLEIHNVRLANFDRGEIRRWARRSQGLDTVGDGLFLLFARDHAPMPDRLESIAARLEATPRYLEQSRSQSVGPQVLRWQLQEIEAVDQLPALIDEIVAAGAELGPAGRHRLDAAAATAKAAIEGHGAWIATTLGDATDEWPLGRERHDEMVELRAFDGLDADAILEIGWQRLADEHAARDAAAREIDPDADVETVIHRVKSDGPADFPAALDAYRVAMVRAREHLIVNDLVTVPDDERIEVIPTPDYLSKVLPFAAYFQPAAFDADAKGIYVVTPAVDGDPDALREHNFASISNTSIHEAYPGHHLQLDRARRQSSLTRLLGVAPEFIEGWGMYSELMMREEGFDTGPRSRLALHTDAIWRSCRVILDVRMHRGELTVDEATDFLVEQTHFQRSVAKAEVDWYTNRPTYPLSYLLGRELLLRLRADERRRLGDAFDLKTFHDSLLDAGSLPISFQRRLLQGEGRPVAAGG